MKKCPNCGQKAERTDDWACRWCGYPLLSGSVKKTEKTFREVKGRVDTQKEEPMAEPEEVLRPDTEPAPAPEPEPKPGHSAWQRPSSSPPSRREAGPQPEPDYEEYVVEEEEEEPAPAPRRIVRRRVVRKRPVSRPEPVRKERPPEKKRPVVRRRPQPEPEPVIEEIIEEVPEDEYEEEYVYVTEGGEEDDEDAEEEWEDEDGDEEEDYEDEDEEFVDEDEEEGYPEEENFEEDESEDEYEVEESEEDEFEEEVTEPDASLLEPTMEITVDDLLGAYEEEGEDADSRFSGQIIRLSGKVRRVEIKDALGLYYMFLAGDTEYILLEDVKCVFGRENGLQLQELLPDEQVTVQGRYSGSLIEIRLIECGLIQ